MNWTTYYEMILTDEYETSAKTAKQLVVFVQLKTVAILQLTLFHVYKKLKGF